MARKQTWLFAVVLIFFTFLAGILLKQYSSLNTPDYFLFQLINSPQNNLIDLIFVFISQIPFLVFLVSVLPLLFDRRKVLIYALVIITTFVISDFLKTAVQRPRPEGFLLVAEQYNHSFPSTHASVSIAWANIMTRFYEKHKALFFVFAILVGFSRIYVGVHYPFDVFFGFLLGYAISNSFIIKEKQIAKVFRSLRLI